jgi:alpha-galactosidase
MDIRQSALNVSRAFCEKMAQKLNRKVKIESSTDLRKALNGADFVVTAIELDRYHYWSMDFHIPRRYGFRQVYGENGGLGGMFHTLHNLPPMIEIARAMEKECPDAWMLSYTNPEAKLIEGVLKLTKTKAVGLCHGVRMGVDQLALLLNMPSERIATKAVGLNHFGWFTKIWDKETGEDLYPKLREQEKKVHWLAHWDECGLTRIMFRTYGLWSYPGTNHVGEYVAWSDDFLASSKIQYFFDPASEHPWESKTPPEFVYSFSSNPTARELFPKEKPFVGDPGFIQGFNADNEDYAYSREYGIPSAESIFFDVPAHFDALNVLNKGYAPNLLENMVIEIPTEASGRDIQPLKTDPLPLPIASMISTQGAIHQLVIEAYLEKSRNKLLQAVLLDPTVSSYNNAVAMINEMCERQKEILPVLNW